MESLENLTLFWGGSSPDRGMDASGFKPEATSGASWWVEGAAGSGGLEESLGIGGGEGGGV